MKRTYAFPTLLSLVLAVSLVSVTLSNPNLVLAQTPNADLSIIKADAQNQVTVGDAVHYTVTVTNNGPDAAQNVVMTDTLPSGVTLVSHSPGQGSCNESGGVVTCDLGDISAGTAIATVIVVTANVVGRIENNASVTSATNDPNSSNNSATEITDIVSTSGPQADLVASMTDTPDPVVVGENVTYTVNITNNGPNNSSGVVVTNTLPAAADADFVSATPSQGLCTAPSDGKIICVLDDINALASPFIDVVVTTTNPASISNRSLVTSSTTDPDSSNNADEEFTTVNPAPINVPDVVGLTQADAESSIVSAGLVVGSVTTVSDPVVPSGNVISQNPAAGTAVSVGSSVDLVVSSGPPPIVNNPRTLKQDALSQTAPLTGQRDAILLAHDFIQDSLNPTLWLDDFHLTSSGSSVFDFERNAIAELLEMRQFAQNLTATEIATSDLVFNNLTEADRILASTLIEDVETGTPLDPSLQPQIDSLISQAKQARANGVSEQSSGSPALAVDHFKDSWTLAIQALDLLNQPAPTPTTSLTVTKVVVNNDGGSALVSDFVLRVDGSQVVSGASNTFAPGSYVVSEDPASGYAASFSGDCDAAGNVSLALGDVKSCTITNDDIPASLTVTKIVVNDDGGSALVSDFVLRVDGSQVVSGASNTFAPGSYVVSEDPASGYAASFSGDCDAAGNVSLALGDVKSCTITNDDIPASLTVTKIVVNDDGGSNTVSDFVLRVDGSPVTSGAVNSLPPGSYLVSEDPATGYAASFSGDCDSNGNISLALGDTKSCTITNDDIPASLSVTKIVVNDDGGSALVSDFVLRVDGSQVVSGASNTFAPGSHVVSEDPASGYAASFSGDCDAAGNVSLALGDVKSCTITNDDIPASLTVTKIVVNDDGGSNTVSDFVLRVDGSPVTSGAVNSLPPGSYLVSEDPATGYAASFSGDCDSNGNISLALGDTKSCTITNDDIPASLSVTKIVVNDDGGSALVSDFTLRVDGAPVVSGASNTFAPGSHVVSEDPAPGYAASFSGDCDAVGNVSLALGDVKSCTITNDDIPALVAVPDVVGLSQTDAESAIIAVGLTVGTVSTSHDPAVPAGDIVSQNPPAGASVLLGAAVDLVVSLGPQSLPVVAYSFNEPSGSTVFDVSGNGNDGTISGASRVTGKYGSGLFLDGVNDYVTGVDLRFFSGPFSISTWFKASPAASPGAIIHKFSGSTNQNYYIYLLSDGRVMAGLYDGNDWQEVITSGAALNDGAWHHVAMVVGTSTIELFIDGVSVGSDTHYNTFRTNTQPFNLGRKNDGVHYFSGSLDDLRIHNKAQSRTEIQTDMNTPL